MSRRLAPALATLLAVGGAAVFVFVQLRPGLLFLNTTPAGGDMGAHVWGPAFLRDHLLPHGRLTGWAPDWYAGFPFPSFYFPVPTLLIVLVDVFLPYSIAFKLVSVLGLVSLPVAAWAFGRLAGLRAPGPACLAVATVPFLFDRSFTIYGGNIPSTLAGEFSFSVSLSLALVFLGVLAKSLDTGRHRALAAVLLALTLLSHVIPTFFAVAAAVAMVLLRPSVRRIGRTVVVGTVAGLLAAFWALPLVMALPYTNDMGWEKIVVYRKNLFPHDVRWLLFAAGAGALVSVTRRCRVGDLLSVMAVVAGLGFRFAPQGKIWNARLLPFWFLCLYMLAGLAAAALFRALASVAAYGPSRDRAQSLAALVAPPLVLVATLVFVALPLQALPSWSPLKTADRSFIPSWTAWNYSGYERKATFGEYRQVIDTMARVGRTEGCGRAMWEYEPELNELGTPLALMLLPYWTDSCIGSMEGLYYESSATTPYHFLAASEVSKRPSRPQRDLPYRDLDLNVGVPHLQMLGVRYYMAFSPEARALAAQHPDLDLVASTGPFPVNYTEGPGERRWEIYRVAGSDIVSPLDREPVVAEGVDGEKKWLAASVQWWQDPARAGVPLADDGPRGWQRVGASGLRGGELPSSRTVRPARVSGIRTGDDRISFDVDRPGSPVLVKTSYFPNWKASGARGPWRVTPNLMVVVPTERHVEMKYGYSPADLAGYGFTAIGAGLAVVLWRRRPAPDETHDPAVRLPGAMTPLDEIFKAYDVRGVVPDQLDAEVCRRIGASFARFAEAPRILVGRDMRASGVELSAAFAEGAMSQGVDVVDLGLASTDLVYFAAGHLDAPGAMFTASHNPARYNGVKLCLSGARPVGEDTGLAEVKAGAADPPAPAPTPGSMTQLDLLDEFAAHVRSFVDMGVMRPLKVVADTANGMGGLVVPRIFDGLPFDLEILFPELDGSFPNHPPDPIQPENLKDLQARVLETGADVGLAFDGDADRVFLVDEKGEPVSGSLTTAMVAKAMLEKHPGETVAYNLICSKAVAEVITEQGGTPLRTRVGHSFIKAVMAVTGAVFAGEHSGHYYFRDNYRADSGLIAAMIVLELMSKAAQPLSELRKPFERYAASGELNREVVDPVAVIEQVSAAYAGAHQDRVDGLTVDLGDWWFNLRPSNTEPLLRLNLEAPTPAECDARVAEVLSHMQAL